MPPKTGETATVTTNEEFLEAAQNANVTKIIVDGDITVDATPEAGETLATVETAAEILITGEHTFSIAEDTCLVSTAGVGQFHYETIPVQGNENYDRLTGGRGVLPSPIYDDGYYRELYGSPDNAKAALIDGEKGLGCGRPSLHVT